MGLVLSESKTDLWPQAFQMERTAKRGCMLGGDRAGFGYVLTSQFKIGRGDRRQTECFKTF